MTQKPQSPKQRHNKRMQKKKVLIDESIAKADKEKGLLLILTGNGKGKSSSAFGMIARALGHGMKVGVVQFIKGRTDTGEEAYFSKDPDVDWQVMGEGFTWDTQNHAQDINAAQKGWAEVQRMLNDPSYDLVILDEFTYVLKYQYLDTDVVMRAIKARPEMQHVVITGRAASAALRDAADTVAEISDEKHAYRAGIKAQKGVDY
jgi:cob(I)alamin adenosyltransferase